MEINELKKWEKAYDEAYPQTPYEEKAETRNTKRRARMRLKLLQLENTCFMIDYYTDMKKNFKDEAIQYSCDSMLDGLNNRVEKLEEDIINAMERK